MDGDAARTSPARRGARPLMAPARVAAPEAVLGRASSASEGVASGPPTSVTDLRLRNYDFNAPALPFGAREAAAPWQKNAAVIVLGLWIGAALVDYRLPLSVTLIGLTLSFALVIVVRTMALWELWRTRGQWRQRGEHARGRRLVDAELPVYSVLIALYKEAEVVGDLLAALEALDYPHAKLDVLFVIEPDDLATSAAILARRTRLPIRVILASEVGPRTKPKALNCALPHVRGEYLVIYDAEDRPEPDQLRKALAIFLSREDRAPKRPHIVCVQAELNVFNARDSWLSRQFAIEYSTLFGAILPSMSRRRWPIPLGGTSNHFVTSALLQLGGWDPYNVTEDADLGIRIARRGWGTAVVRSTTWEEAPRTFVDWLKQRTRWIKGWIVTLLVHTKQPTALVRDLGWSRTVALLVTMGGMVLSSFFNPLAWVATAGWLAGWYSTAAIDDAPLDLESVLLSAILLLSIGNLVIGYGVAILTAAIATRRYHGHLAWFALTLPVYWLVISLAAVRAAVQMNGQAHVWEKTPHGKSLKANSRKPVER